MKATDGRSCGFISPPFLSMSCVLASSYETPVLQKRTVAFCTSDLTICIIGVNVKPFQTQRLHSLAVLLPGRLQRLLFFSILLQLELTQLVEGRTYCAITDSILAFWHATPEMLGSRLHRLSDRLTAFFELL